MKVHSFFELSIARQTTDMGEVFLTATLLDCGATDKFIHSNFMKRNRIMTRLLSQPIPIYNMDGTLNKAGSITKVVKMMLQYRDHSEKTLFTVTSLRKQDITLGLTWLCEHNPKVNWKSGEVKMSHCPNHCRTCHEVNVKRKEQLTKEVNIRSCHAGPMPKPDVEMEDIHNLGDVSDDEEEEEEPYTGEDAMEEGD
jgi:Retroviral aspartyl protease